jgi:carbamate kinase
MYNPEGNLVGVEAVIDKDHASGLLATGLKADLFVMATDADAVYVDWKLPTQRAIATAHPEALMELRDDFPPGSMQPKVEAACEFVAATGARAAIGGLQALQGMVAGTSGTIVTNDAVGITYHPD